MTESQFHGLLEENPDAIIIVDRTGHIIFASNRIEAMFGYLADELFGTSPLPASKPGSLFWLSYDSGARRAQSRRSGVCSSWTLRGRL